MHTLKRAVQIKEDASGAHSHALVSFLQNLGGLWAFAGNNTKAKQVYDRAIRIAELQPKQDKAELKTLNQELESIKSGRFTKRLYEFWQMEA